MSGFLPLFSSILGRGVLLTGLLWGSAALGFGQEPPGKPVRDFCLIERPFRDDIPISDQVPGLLLEAVAKRDAQCVQTLLEKGASPNEPDGAPLRRALLLFPIIPGKFEIATILLDHGADIEFRDRAGKTALIRAVEANQFMAVRFLLGRGAAVNIKVANDDPDTVQKEVSLLFSAVKRAGPTVLQMLMDAGAEVNYATQTGKTVLMNAPDDAEIVETLLKGGARIDLRDVYGHTAGCYAVMKNEKKKLAALHNFDPNLEIGCP